MDLCNRSEVKRLLDKYSLSPKKAFGQNFLVNSAIPRMIAENSYELACAAGNGVHAVLEIGPGVGALTSRLAECYDKVVAVEIDHGLIPLLGESLADYDNVEVVEADFMTLCLEEFLEEKFGDIWASGGNVSVCANLPYYITSPVIMKLVESFSPERRLPFAAITVMVQLEVADRLCADAGSSVYGSVTASLALHANARKLFTVSPGSFHPVPKVSSAVVGIIPHGGICEIYKEATDSVNSPLEIVRCAHRLIELAFGQRRKTFVNAVSSAYSKESLLSALETAGLRNDVRGEKLSAYDFCRLADILII